ncbi:MAG: DinB family protein [Rhodothermales bacterium]
MADAKREEQSRLRTTLLDQLAYLYDEIEVLKGVVDRVPEKLQEGRPTVDELSLKETYGLLATLDADVRLPRLRQIIAEDEPRFDAIDEQALAAQSDWNARPMEAILEQVQAARQTLLEAFQALPEVAWSRAAHFSDPAERGQPVRRDVYSFAHHITQHDTDVLRAIGYRLHDSHLTSRPQDLPK